jgi:hypothetical protein
VRKVLVLYIKPIRGVPTLGEDSDSPQQRFVDIDLNPDAHIAAPTSPCAITIHNGNRTSNAE